MHFSANNFALGLSQYVNGAMLVDFTLGDVNLVDARPESKTGINKIIGRYGICLSYSSSS